MYKHSAHLEKTFARVQGKSSPHTSGLSKFDIDMVCATFAAVSSNGHIFLRPLQYDCFFI